MSDETTLADLLQLNLHRYEDEVRGIVDKAVKESGMEKVGQAWGPAEVREPNPGRARLGRKAALGLHSMSPCLCVPSLKFLAADSCPP